MTKASPEETIHARPEDDPQELELHEIVPLRKDDRGTDQTSPFYEDLETQPDSKKKRFFFSTLDELKKQAGEDAIRAICANVRKEERSCSTSGSESNLAERRKHQKREGKISKGKH